MGIWDILKKKIANEENNHHSAMDDSVIGKDVYEIAAFDVKNATIEEKITYFLTNRSQGEQIQLADQLLREGPHDLCISLYQSLIQKYPEERDRYENAIGNAYIKNGDFDKALEYYKLSRLHGIHPDISEKNIWDACHKMYKATGDLKYIHEYTQLSTGKYLEKAQEIIGSPNGNPNISESKTEGKLPEIKDIGVAIPNEQETLNKLEIENQSKEDQFVDDMGRKKQTDVNQISLFGFDDEADQKEETTGSNTENSTEVNTKNDTFIDEADSFDLAENVEESTKNYTESLEERKDEPVSYIDETESFNLSKKDEVEENTQTPPEEAPNMLTAFDYHIDRFFAYEDVIVLEDKRTDELKIDIFHVKPNVDRNFNLLLTYGMSRKPMNVPKGREQFKYGELAMLLPRDWDLSHTGLKDINNYWPILWLKNLARIPANQNSWLCYGHSIPNGEPPKPIANTNFEGVVIMDSASLPDEFQELNIGDESLFVYTVIPVFANEMQFKVKNGIDALRDAFIDTNVKDVIWSERPSAFSTDNKEI